MKLVLIESPFAGDVEKNLRYLRAAMRDCFLRGEAPFASHALYTQPGVLDDNVPSERKLGIDAGLLWGAKAEKTVVYTNLGISGGMWYGIDNAEKADRKIEYRSLSGWGCPQCLKETCPCNNCHGTKLWWNTVDQSYMTCFWC